MSTQSTNEVATLGGGCFWCLEPVYEALRGVESVTVGYAGGQTSAPSYEQVCGGSTGHAEVVQVTYNPEIVSFQEILEVFLAVHNPTTLNRQGADVGTQYRSIILYHDAKQKETAEKVITALNEQGDWDKELVTEVVALEKFYPAEEYHQQYYKKNPWAGYCQMVIRPKVSKFKKNYKEQLKPKA